MTREEVLIKYIREYLDIGFWQYEACDLSKDDLELIIKALKQEPILDKIRAEINELPSYVAKFNGGDFSIHIDKERCLQIIDKYRERRR